MRLPRRSSSILSLVALALMLAAVSACTAPATNGDTSAHAAPAPAPATNGAKPTSAASRTATPTEQATQPAPEKPMRTGGPLPADPVESPESKPGLVDTRCNSDADCTVKNVGNCCGYYPACVNKNSPTDPDGVKAECAKKGMASVCGFQEISSCSCKQGRCEAVSTQVVQ